MPRNFYSARRDAARCLSTDFRDALPYQLRESLYDNPSGRQVHSDEEDFVGDIVDENSPSFATSVRLSVRTPLQSTTIHNQPLPGLHQSGVLAMLQQQQELLQKVLKQQEEMKTQQTALSKKIGKTRGKLPLF